MAKKGHIVTEEHRKKLSESHKGQKAWNKGLVGIYSDDTRKRMSFSAKNRKRKPFSEETKLKIKLKLKGKKYSPLSEEHKEKIRIALKGKSQKHPNRKSTKGIPTNYIPKSAFKNGRTPWNYIDGRSTRSDLKKRYGKDWPKIRNKIIERDGYSCQKCKCDGIKLEVHHIIPFMISKDNSIENLISLCKRCHREIEAEEMRLLKNKNIA